METDTIELWSLVALILVLLAGYLWLRHHQQRRRLERERKLKCKELVLDNRLPLARRKVDFDLLVELVKMGIDVSQLEKVVELLTAVPVEYQLEDDGQGGGLHIEFDIGDELADSMDEDTKNMDGQGKSGDTGNEETVEVVVGMPAEKEKAWFRMAHNRYRHALADKEITDRQARFRMLVKMVELGKRAVQDDSTKPVNRKAYELELWDRFYENEYLELNQE